MFALIDCNNFYASCERLFRPDLHQKPVIVLSNNDGCVIARSNEAKNLGIKMGEPYFKIKPLCKQHKVQVFSSNFALYGDLSQRVMSTIAEHASQVEIYSIDEAFINLKNLANTTYTEFATMLQKRILKYTGIPTSIGIGKTKTLAKAASYLAKKHFHCPVVHIESVSPFLQQIPIQEIWGVGKQWAKKLGTFNIHTAKDLMDANPAIIRRQCNVLLQRTAYELNGISCIGLNEIEPKQSIISSRSFGTPQLKLEDLNTAISSHVARAWEKVRKQQSLVQYLSVFIQSNRFNPHQPQYTNTSGIKLIIPNDDLRLLTRYALTCLQGIYKENIHYKKAGVIFTGLVPKAHQQLDLFATLEPNQQLHTEKLMLAIEQANQRFGPGTLRLAAEGYTKPWAMKQILKSPSYTTKWSEIPIVF